MARTLQKLINYHTGNASAMPTTDKVEFGEIVVRHNSENPQLLIKVSDGGTEYFVPFIASAQISTAIETKVTEVAGTLASSIDDVDKKVDALSGSVINNYWTSAQTKDAIDTAEQEAKDYADSQDEALSGRVVNYITTEITSVLSGDTDALAAEVAKLKEFSGNVATNYATKAYADSGVSVAIETAVGTAEDASTADTVHGAKKYADEKDRELSGNVVTYVDDANAGISSRIDTTNTKLNTLSASVVSFSGTVGQYIDERLTTVYNVKGSVPTLNDLPSTDIKTGDVYNVVAAVGEPGDEDYTPAGTNYVWTGSEWDALGGTIDLSGYATTAVTNGLNTRVTSLEQANNAATASTAALSGTVSAFSATVVNDYATKEYADQAEQDAKFASSAYTDGQILMLSGITSAYVASELSTVKSDISDLKNDSATHTEVATASGNVFVSAVTSAVTESKSYTDDAIEALVGTATESGNTLGELEDAINRVASQVTTDTDTLSQKISALEQFKEAKEDIIDSAIQGAEFAAVATTDANFSGGDDRQTGRYASGAKLKYTEGGNIVLDLSELIIDCGDFE